VLFLDTSAGPQTAQNGCHIRRLQPPIAGDLWSDPTTPVSESGNAISPIGCHAEGYEYDDFVRTARTRSGAVWRGSVVGVEEGTGDLLG
jgi:hypothetical protein